MPFQPAPDCAEAVIQGEIAGVNLANVLNFKFPGGYSQADIDNLAAAIDNSVGANYLPILAAAVTYNNTLVRGLANIIDFTASNSVSTGTGGVAGATNPNNVSLVCTIRTGLTGRSARGRFYAMPMSSASLSATNTFSATITSGLEAFLADILAVTSAIGWQFSVLSRFSGGARRASAIATPVTVSVCRNGLVDSQRHRLPRGH